MPNPSTPETHGSTTRYDTKFCLGNRYTCALNTGTNFIRLMPGGYLAALSFDGRGNYDYYKARIEYELTDVNGQALYGDTIKFNDTPINQVMHLLILDEPIPNLNAVACYVIQAISDRPCVVEICSYNYLPGYDASSA